ncbi:hypothetical protein MMC11_004053 [Xylographa trunciseda]|nr:hypothetical protein [Xylographa trunciseda]
MPRIVIAGKETEVDPNNPASVHAAQLWLQELCKLGGNTDELEKCVDMVAELLVDPLLWPSLMRSAPLLTVKAVDVPAEGGGVVGVLQRTLKRAGLLGLCTRLDDPSEPRRDLMELRISQVLRLSSRRPAHCLASAVYEVAEDEDSVDTEVAVNATYENLDVERRELIYMLLCHIKRVFGTSHGPAVDQFIEKVREEKC